MSNVNKTLAAGVLARTYAPTPDEFTEAEMNRIAEWLGRLKAVALQKG